MGSAAEPTPVPRLQFGLDAVVEENRRPAVIGAGRTQEASIRPRRCRRGEPHRRSWAVGFSPASIRPRRCRRGERYHRRRGVRTTTRFNSASTLSSRRTAPAREAARRAAPSIRPRRCRRGERSRAVDARRRWKPFNSASTLSSRRTRALDLVYFLGRLPSIRPRRCRRGERSTSSAARRTSSTFNSASTLSSRRTPHDSPKLCGLLCLQFGLDAVVEENDSGRS